MIWYDMIWYDMIWYDMIWCDVMWCDVMWCDVMWYMIWYIISYHIISYHIISYHIIPYHIISYHFILYYIILYYIKKCKAVPLQAWSGPEGSRKLRFSDIMTTVQDDGKVVSLKHRPPLPPGNTPGTHFCKRLSQPQGHSATGRIMSLKNSNDTIGNRTRDLSICSVVP